MITVDTPLPLDRELLRAAVKILRMHIKRTDVVHNAHLFQLWRPPLRKPQHNKEAVPIALQTSMLRLVFEGFPMARLVGRFLQSQGFQLICTQLTMQASLVLRTARPTACP